MISAQEWERDGSGAASRVRRDAAMPLTEELRIQQPRAFTVIGRYQQRTFERLTSPILKVPLAGARMAGVQRASLRAGLSCAYLLRNVAVGSKAHPLHGRRSYAYTPSAHRLTVFWARLRHGLVGTSAEEGTAPVTDHER